jgi:hypothetical protein
MVSLTDPQMLPNNMMMRETYTYLRTSHRTLMIFRRSVQSGAFSSK